MRVRKKTTTTQKNIYFPPSSSLFLSIQKKERKKMFIETNSCVFSEMASRVFIERMKEDEGEGKRRREGEKKKFQRRRGRAGIETTENMTKNSKIGEVTGFVIVPSEVLMAMEGGEEIGRASCRERV